MVSFLSSFLSRRIVAGFCLLALCKENKEQIEIQLYEHLHRIFYKFGVVSIS